MGIFGGTFDPVHQGHMVIAEQVMGELGLDHILFVPAGIPPHKEASSVRASTGDRYDMVEAAVEATSGSQWTGSRPTQRDPCTA